MIDDDFWARADELFDAALDLPPESRKSWLDAVCEAEPDLRAKVEQLLQLSASEDERLRPNRASAELVRELMRRFQSRDTLAACPPTDETSSTE